MISYTSSEWEGFIPCQHTVLLWQPQEHLRSIGQKQTEHVSAFMPPLPLSFCCFFFSPFFKSFNVEVILTLISYAIANHLTKQVCCLTSHLYGNCLCWLALLLKPLSSQFLCICGCVMYWTSRECKNVRIPLLLHIVSQLIQTKQSLVSVESNQSQ